jgi:putative ABC transport system permease protein
MPPLYRLLSFRYIRNRWDRAALIVASIALGVSTLVSARILNQCVETAAAQTTTPMQGSADLYVTNGELGVLKSVADEIRDASLPGVAAVQPFVFERVTLPDLSGRPAVLIGAELTQQVFRPDNPLGVSFTRTMEFTRAAALNALNRRLVVVTRAVHDDWERARADKAAPLVVRYGSRSVECFPLGIIDFAPDSPLAQLGWNLVGMEIGQAARFIRPGPSVAATAVAGAMAEPAWEAANPPRVSRVDVFLDRGTDRASAEQAVAAVVGDRAKVNTPEAQGQATQEIVGGLKVGFLLCSAGAMVVGLFLVYNALSVTVAERRHDIGILRSIGATRGQVIRLFTIAAVLLGLAGAALGIPLGVGLARYTLYEFREELKAIFLNPDTDPGQLTLATALLALIAGVATAVLAALVPAVQAASDQPADVVRRVPGAAGGFWGAAHRATCAVLVSGGLTMIVSRHELPARLGAFGGMLAALVGLLLSAPILVGGLVRLIQPILRRVLPIEARLAADNLIRSPGRTGVVIGALGAGVAVMIQTAGVGKSNEEPVIRWLDEIILADEYVFAGSMAEATSSIAPMDPVIVRELGRLPGVERVTALRYVRPEYNGTVVFMIAIDAGPFADAVQPRAAHGATDLDKFRGLAGRDAVVVSDNFALKHNVRPGDTITLPGPSGPVRLYVADAMKDYSWNRGSMFIDRATYARLFNDNLVDVCHVFLTDHGEGQGAAGREAVKAFCADRGLIRFDRPTVRGFFAGLIDRAFKLAYLQQIVVGIVAALGVVTALLISVLQRKRELGLLLAVGATPGQVIRSVLAEAALMGLFGTLLGVLIGVPMEWYVLRVIMLEESGFVFDVVFPWRPAAAIAIGAVGTATLAGLLPALHAVRTRIVDAIAYE